MSHSPRPPLSTGRARALAVVVTVLWSSSWVLIRNGLDGADQPLTFAGLRYGLAAIVLAAWLLLRRRPVSTPSLRRSVGRRDLVALGVLGVVQFAVTQGAQFVAIDRQPLATTSLVLAMCPLLVAVGGTLIGERFTARQLAGSVLIVLGAFVYFRGELGATPTGLIAAIVGVLATSASVLSGRSYLRRSPLPVATITVFSMGIGATTLLAVGLAVEGLPTITWRFVAIVAWLAIVNTAAAFAWWNTCLRTVPATEMAALNGMMTPQIALLGWIFFDEAIGPAEGIGLILVIGAIALVNSTRTPRPLPAAAAAPAAD